MNPPITPQQAIAILDTATQPANIYKLSRDDFVRVQTALIVLNEIVNPKKEETPKH